MSFILILTPEVTHLIPFFGDQGDFMIRENLELTFDAHFALIHAS